MIRAIAFDLWETLITNTPDVSRAHQDLRMQRLEAVLAARGHQDAASRLALAYRNTWERCLELYWSRDRDIPCRRQVEHFVEALDLDPAAVGEDTLAALEDAYAHVAVDVLPEIVPGAAEVVRELQQREYRLGLISNTGRTPGYALRRILDQLGLAPFFDAMVFSNEHGACKPQRSIFEALRGALDVRFEEMLFVGDNLYVDVHGAQQCGIPGVHFIPAARGTAVAPPVEHDLRIEPVATIRDLGELLGVIESAA